MSQRKPARARRAIRSSKATRRDATQRDRDDRGVPANLALVRCENCGHVQPPDAGAGNWGLGGTMGRHLVQLAHQHEDHRGEDRQPWGPSPHDEESAMGERFPVMPHTGRTRYDRGTRTPSGRAPEPSADDAAFERAGLAGRGPRGYRRSDERIREDVCDALLADPGVDASGIEVSVSDGEVTLKGTVADRRSKRRSEWLCDGVAGVADVRNELRIDAAGAETAGRPPVAS